MAFLGIDIGGTKRVIVIGDPKGRPLAQLRRPMEQSGDWRADLATLVEDIRRLLAETGSGSPGQPLQLERIGISVPGPVDAERGILLNPPNLPDWHDVAIGKALREAFPEFGNLEIRVENDANAAVLAEHAAGAGRGVEDLVYLTMSTGVGAGILSGGRLLRGAFGGAGEAGHLPIEWPGRACRCGLRGCLEAYVGGHAWGVRLREVVPDSSQVLARAGGDRQAVRPEHLVAAARAGDAFALEEFGRWLDHLARGIRHLVMLFEPERIVLGTIATAAGESLCFEPLRRRVARVVWPRQAERLSIVPAELGAELPQRAGLAVALAGTRVMASAL